MIIKRYYAPSMAEAMAIIRAELGADAVILSSKPVRQKGLKGFFQKKQLEVMAAYEPRLESDKAREERQSNAYAVALRAAKQGTENPSPRVIPPTPGAPLGPVKPERPTATSTPAKGNTLTQAKPTALQASAASKVAAAYQNTRAEEKGKDLKNDLPIAESIAEALSVARAAQENAAQIASEREAIIARETEEFIPFSPPEMIITDANRSVTSEPEPDLDRIDQLDQKITAMAEMMGVFTRRFDEGDVYLPMQEDTRALYHQFLAQDVEPELAKAMAMEAQELAPRIGQEPAEAMLRLILRDLHDTAPLTFEKGKRRVLLFMGPTGVGKTTTLVKLATMCSVRQGLKVGLINSDTYRIAAQEQLKIYADILAVPKSVIYAPDELAQAIQAMEDREVIFVDTAGKRPGDLQHQKDMQILLQGAGEDAIAILCVAAPTGARALRQIIAHYDFLPSYGVVLTKIDETHGLGAAINICAFSGQSLHYLTSGQSVPDDIEEADARSIARRLLG